MAWTPAFGDWAGLLPVLRNAKAIIERDIAEALVWAYGPNTPPATAYSRIQFTQRHSREYPLLVIQAATDTPKALGSGGVEQEHVFDVQIYLTREVSTATNFGGEVDALAEDVIRFYDATVMAFLSASSSDWRANFPNDGAGKVKVWCTNAVFGQLQVSTETGGKYLHDVAFELRVQLIESYG